MDRLLELTDPILVSLEANLDLLQELAGGNDVWPFLLQQLSSSAWAYNLGNKICLVTRGITAMARVDPDRVAGGILVLERLAKTTPQDVTAAFREGYKITATWASDEADDPSMVGTQSGAAKLQEMLGGDETTEIASPARIQAQDSIPRPSSVPSGPLAVKPEGPILPQGEIDKLVNSIHGGSVATGAQPAPEPAQNVPGMAGEPWPPVYEPSIRTQSPSPQAASGESEFPSQPLTLSAGVSPDEWVEQPIKTIASSIGQTASNGPVSSLYDLVVGQPFTILVFEQRADFYRELESLRDLIPGTLMASWENNLVFLRLGPRLLKTLEDYRARYRAAAAALESSITRVRQTEQLLPNLHNYRDQQASLAAEAEKVTGEMRTIRLRQVLETREGHFLARRVFSIEALREGLWRDLIGFSYGMMRHPKSSLLRRSRFAKRRLKYLAVQRQLESSLARLSALEREVQRRLEYQADWQALVSRQFKIEREQDGIGRFIRATTIPGGPPFDPESLNSWLESEWDTVRRKEKLLRAWQECLTDEKAWSVRLHEEPVAVLGDASMLTIPGIARGALVVVLAQNHAAVMTEAPEECTGWIMVDPGYNTIGSGRGFGHNGDPLLTTIAGLAKETGFELQEAMQLLGFEDRTKKQGME